MKWGLSQVSCAVPVAGVFHVSFMAAESPCIPGGRGDRQTAGQAV